MGYCNLTRTGATLAPSMITLDSQQREFLITNGEILIDGLSGWAVLIAKADVMQQIVDAVQAAEIAAGDANAETEGV